ncbi:thiol peroxidase [Carnobacterium pleistocenium]|uniref:thiol peroxidase n=1 Tax=Carnobacterium pleistocenium TaxID=181073 RepID=UPI0005596E7B|nr:thiol peroxidase [Carnobacterium pleistocenium]
MEITRKGTPYKLKGIQTKVGDKAPNFKAGNLVDGAVELSDFYGKVVLISVIPDIDTRVCALQAKSFNKIASELDGVQLITISNNTKAEQAEWCAGKDISMEMLHDNDLEFGQAYGLVMEELGKLARSVFVVDSKGEITYQEIVSEMTSEPDYNKAIEAAKEAR